MTHHDDRMFSAPMRLVLNEGDAVRPVRDVRLVVRGQGTVGFTPASPGPFDVTIGTPAFWGPCAYRWRVDYERVALFQWVAGGWDEVRLCDAPNNLPSEGGGTGLDRDPRCTYWFSIDGHNRTLGYGTGEMRVETRIAKHDLPAAPEEGPDPQAWLSELTHVALSPPSKGRIEVWRDPVVVAPALKVVPMDAISMVDMAEGVVTVAAHLTPECQRLYGTVAGRMFVLDDGEFSSFGDAIQASIDDPRGWCARTLKRKANEFGPSDPAKTYLRITMGFNQGESPGVPFVMEIWPQGHSSPIHNHGGADAVIRVLRGTITVDLYRMLSLQHTRPFATATFTEGDVTWISPTLNQTHMLRNQGDMACVTIQCYNYPESDDTHYNYFDYLQSSSIGHFTPNSDMDFLAFRKLMRDEWRARRSIDGHG